MADQGLSPGATAPDKLHGDGVPAAAFLGQSPEHLRDRSGLRFPSLDIVAT
jgi:hypothetical protein